MSRHALIFALLALLLTGCSTLVSVETVPFQYEGLNMQPVPPKPTETPPAPDSPLAVPMAMAASPAVATFGLAELETSVAAAGGELRPGTYSCDLIGNDYVRCRVRSDGVPGGEICVWAGGWGACE